MNSFELTRRSQLARLMTVIGAYICIALAFPAIAEAATVYVDIALGSDLAGTGTITRPYQHITKGLDEALPGDTVRVASGEYSVATGETLPLFLPIGITLQGDSTPFMAPERLLGTVIEGNDAGPMLYITGGNENTVVDGIAFMENDSPTNGAAISIIGGSAPGGGPQIRDCFFYGLRAPLGGAVHASRLAYSICQPRIERCAFVYCLADSGSKLGGAIYGTSANLRITDSYFLGCATETAGRGGGIALRGGGASVISGCVFASCDAPGGNGGAVDAVGHSVAAFSTLFAGCDAFVGGAVYLQDDHSGDPDALAVYSSIFLENTVSPGGIGAAVRVYEGQGLIVNCTAYGNTGGAAVASYAGNTAVHNSILWNTATDDLHNNGGTLSVAYSCVHDPDPGIGVIHTDPEFTGPYPPMRLRPTSPCIDSGNNTIAPPSDFEDLPRIVDGDGDSTAVVDMGASERNPRVDRAAGTNRYTTAVEASQEHFEHAETVVLATGSSYPDALCAAPLAGLFNSPVLLTPTSSLAPAVAGELERLEAEKVYVIGGPGAVSETVEYELEDLGYEVERIAGADRYSTSLAVAQELADLLGPALGFDFIVARGDAFPDALAVSPVAYDSSSPVLLTRTSQLPAGFIAKVTALGFTDALVVGGTGAVSNGVVADIDALLAGDVTRIAGANRYETAVEFARFIDTDPEWSWVLGDEFVGLAVGSNFPDALCGGAVCGKMNGPLLLTPTSSLPAGVETYISEKAELLAHVQAFGGESVVAEDVLDEVRALIP